MSIEKNKKIKQTLAETKERRKSQKCFVFKTKINKQKLNAVQREQLDRLFLEAKWFYNHAIIHASQCMVWMADNGYDNILTKKKNNTAGRGDVEKQTTTAKGYGGNIIAEPCCLCSDSKSVSVKHETYRSLDRG